MRDLLLNWKIIHAIKFRIKWKSRIRKPALRLYLTVGGNAKNDRMDSNHHWRPVRVPHPGAAIVLDHFVGVTEMVVSTACKSQATGIQRWLLRHQQNRPAQERHRSVRSQLLGYSLASGQLICPDDSSSVPAPKNDPSSFQIQSRGPTRRRT